MATCVLQVRLDTEKRDQAKKILNELGLDMTTAVRLFFNRIVSEKGLPFPMVIEDKQE